MLGRLPTRGLLIAALQRMKDGVCYKQVKLGSVARVTTTRGRCSHGANLPSEASAGKTRAGASRGATLLSSPQAQHERAPKRR